MRLAPSLVLLAACQYSVDLSSEPRGDQQPRGTGSSDRCAWAELGPDGGDLEHAGVVVSFPAGSIAGTTSVTLCSADDPAGFAPVSEVVELGPVDLALAAPVSVAVPHAGRTDDIALWAVGADGALTRQLRAVDGGGVFAAPLYRAGLLFAAPDSRTLDPYTADPGVADLLLVVDNSCSMSDEQTALANAIPRVLTRLEDSGVDYRIGVTSTDIDMRNNGTKGKLRAIDGERWVESSTVDKIGVFEQMVTLGTTGSGSEKGLGASFLALDPAAAVNPGFQREEAQLAVVVVSDEPDFTSAGLISKAEYVEWFDALKPTPETTWFHSVVLPATGAAYIDVSDEVGGEVYDIDDLRPRDWASFMDTVIDAFYVDDMPLGSPPLDEQVEAWVIPGDGSEPWRLDDAYVDYDLAANRVKITAELGHDDEVVLLYKR